MTASVRIRAELAAAAGVALVAVLLVAPPEHAGHPAAALGRPAGEQPPRRVMERLDRGLAAVPAATGAFLSWRLLGTEHGHDTAFNVYRGSRRLNSSPLLGPPRSPTPPTDRAATPSGP